MVRFRFYKSETEKTQPNPNQKKPSQTGKKQNKTEKTKSDQKNLAKPKPVDLNRFQFGFLKKPFDYFFIKTEPKIITSRYILILRWIKKINYILFYFKSSIDFFSKIIYKKICQFILNNSFFSFNKYIQFHCSSLIPQIWCGRLWSKLNLGG